MRRIFGWRGIFLFAFLITTSLEAATFHPFTGWKTIDTKHFAIHYHQSLEPVAKRAADYLEEAHQKLSPKYDWKPWSQTQVVLTDQYDDSNGLASILPYNWMLLRVVPPSPDSALGAQEGWLKTLITHEYTHILHLDAYRGIWKPIRWFLFGKLVAPAALTPNWVKEGSATFEETLATDGGRGRAAYSEMLLRTAILTDDFPTLDRADGVHWKWPSSQIPYIYGVKFIEYLTDRFGEEKVQQFHRESQKSIFLGAANTFAIRAFGKKFDALWKEWQGDLKKKYAAWEKEEGKRGITDTQIFLGGDDSYSLATFSPDGKKIAYVTYHPRRGSLLWLHDLETGKREKLGKKVPSQMTFSPDGKSLVYSVISSWKQYYLYYDLYQVDLTAKKKKSKRLTKGERARDPDFSPDGKKILFVASEGGTDRLKIYDLKTKKIETLTKEITPFSQFAHPRFSPDGSKIALAHFKNGRGWELCLANRDGIFVKCLTTNGVPVESRPAWSPNGRYLLFHSDRDGVANIYAYDWHSGKLQRVTRVTTGVYQPAFSKEGKLFARYYHGKGFDIREVPLQFAAVAPLPSKKSEEKSTPSLGSEYASRKYSSFRQPLLLPRYVMPSLFVLDNGVQMNAATGSFDPLLRHDWVGGVSYRTDARHWGYFGDYAFRRFVPTFGVGISNFAVDRGIISFTNGNSYHFYEERTHTYFFTSIPLGKKQSIGWSYFYEDRNPITNILAAEAAALNLNIFSGFNALYVYGETESFPASISQVEKGRKLRLVGTITDSTLGSSRNNEQRVFFGDYREYIPLGGNNVFALRMAGGIAWGDRIIPGTFSLGGSLGEGVMAGRSSSRYFSLRGLPLSTLSRDRVMLISGEFRLPLVSPQRAIGNVSSPLFLNNLHLGLFADYGDAWDGRDVRSKSDFSDFFNDFFLGVGLETRADLVIGHSLPVTGRLGYAIIVVNRDRLGRLTDPFIGNVVRNGILILQWGTSF